MNEEIAKPGSIVPKAAAPLRTLTAVMAVMCFLAVIAVGAMLLINRAVEQWAEGLASEATVSNPSMC
jgi:cell division transport system permease protein